MYNRYHTGSYNPSDLQDRLNKLMANPEIDKKDGIYEFLFDGEVKHLSPRKFKDADKRAKYESQNHLCAGCGKEIKDISSAHADHIVPWSKGGRTEVSNLQILCVECNLKKSNEEQAEAKNLFSLA